MDSGTFDGIVTLFVVVMAGLCLWLLIRVVRAVSETSRESETARFRNAMRGQMLSKGAASASVPPPRAPKKTEGLR